MTDENVPSLNRVLSNLVLTTEGIQSIESVLAKLLDKSESKGALVVEKSGQLIKMVGNIKDSQAMSISALSSGAFAATKELARQLGEEEFALMYQQGKTMHMVITALETHDLLVVVFDNSTSIGMVKMALKPAWEELSKVMASLRKQKVDDTSSFKKLIESELDALFG